MRAEVLRLVASGAGSAASRRAAPLYGGLLLVVAVLFGGNGMGAGTLAALLGQPAGLLLLIVWTGLAWPVAAPVLREPHELARAWPIARREWIAANALVLAAVELPWLILFVAGRGALAGLHALGLAMAAHALVAIGGWRATLGGLGVSILWCAPTWAAPLAMLLAVAMLVLAWEAAVEPRPARTWAGMPRQPTLALAVGFGLDLGRRHGLEIGRALAFTAVTTALSALIVRNRGSSFDLELIGRVLAGATPVWIPLAAALVTPLVDGERAAAEAWLAHGVSPRRRAAALLVAVAAVFAPLAAAHTAVVARVAGADGSGLALALGLGGLAGPAVAGLGAALVIRHRRGDEADARRLLPRLLAAVVVVTLAIAILGLPGAALAAAGTFWIGWFRPADDEAVVLAGAR